ncbi:MAG: serine/threonine protein kinase [Lentisphaerae bacterium]|nr:serine/threonine protein kinase [Lentisphaerota bacterium]
MPATPSQPPGRCDGADPLAPTRLIVPGADGAATEVTSAAVLGPYRLDGLLGHGGMALVYRAWAPDGREVALKVLQETPTLPAGMLERFRREAEAAMRLVSHPHIVGILGTGQVGRNHFIAMQLIPGGRTLVDVLRQAPLAEAMALDLAAKIAAALAEAHRAGIIHRDVKPANVLITPDGEPVLADFGLARLEFGGDLDLTVSAMAMGTPRYMAPEQTTSLRAASHLSDMYSFGVVLYEMLTGQAPYRIDTDMGMAEVVRTIRESLPPSPRRHCPGLSSAIEAVVMKLPEKAPQRRYATMDLVLSDLEACRHRSRVKATPFSLGYRLDRFVVRHRAAVVAAMAGLGLLLGGLLWHRAALRSARHRQVLPQAEAASRALELAHLRRALDAAVVPPVASPREHSQAALLQPGGAAAALDYLDQARRQAVSPDELRRLDRDRAWALLAAGQNAEALRIFRELHEHGARVRERERVAHQDPHLNDARYALACLDEALATELAGGSREAAVSLWEHARDELVPQAPQATLCAAALGELSAAALADWAAGQRPGIAALGYLLAALRAPATAPAAAWRGRARDLANPAVPWLYYWLSNTPGSASAEAVPTAQETPP